ncbi:MAG: glycosyltransferase family 2 protein [Candidatus ainarchaeum sp.]|nr:glycosyltransferase family 2 protein [Candidatus ainarchaeum sp.]
MKKSTVYILKKSLFFFFIFSLIVGIFLVSLRVSMFGFLIISSFYLYLLITFLFVYYYYPNIEKKGDFPKKAPTVAVVTYAYNDFKPIEKTIKQLKKLKYPIPFTIYVLTDGTCKFLQKYKNVKLIPVSKDHFQKGRNIKAEIMNEGLKKINEENLFCLDGDTIVNPNALIEMTKLLKGKVAVVNTTLVPANTNNFLEKLQMFEYHINWGMAMRVLSALNSISIPVGGLFLIKNKVFRELDGYDIYNLTEDRELGYRLLEKGYIIRYVSKAKSYTINPNNIKEWYRQRLRWTRGELTTIFKHKHFFFNSKLGTFGSLVLPFTFILQTIGIAMAAGLILNFFRRYFHSMFFLILESIKQGVFIFRVPNLFILPSTMYLAIFSIILFMIYALNAFGLSGFKFKVKDILPFCLFLLFYTFFVGGVYVWSIFLEIINYPSPVFKRKT